ncbi:TPA: hypothetical protein EYP66_10150 [Candidatus Poribacteria bacterium]|nr:hypothetical protein [Candidatus Poribacteria bacterium]
MKFLPIISILLLSFLFALIIIGCKTLSMLATPQEWSKNYALADGVEANDPAFIDGDLNTMGKSRFPEEGVESLQFPLSEALITLPERKPIHRIVIHSPNLQVFDIMARDDSGGWKKIKEVKSNKKEVIDLRITTITDGIRIRVRRTSDDAAERRKNVMRGGGMLWIRGNIRANADISEIELYGYADKTDEPSVNEAFDELLK